MPPKNGKKITTNRNSHQLKGRLPKREALVSVVVWGSQPHSTSSSIRLANAICIAHLRCGGLEDLRSAYRPPSPQSHLVQSRHHRIREGMLVECAPPRPVRGTRPRRERHGRRP